MAPGRSVPDDRRPEALALAGRRPGWGRARRSRPETAGQTGRPYGPGGTVNLIGSGRDKAHEGRSHEGLCPSGHAGDLGPSLKGLGSGGPILAGGGGIAAEVEEIVDLIGGGEEALGLAS